MSPAVLLAAVAAYLAVVIGLGWRLSRRSAGSADFFRGGRKSPWWAVAVAMVSTSISGITFVSVPGMVAASQWSYLQMALGFVAGYAVIAYVLLPLYYRMDLNSLYTWLEARFGRWSHRAGAGFFLLSKVLICGVRMYLTAIVLQLVVFGPLGIPFWVNVAATMLCVWLYTFRGGVRTLVWTDMLQTLALLTVVVLCLVRIGREMGLDFGAMCTGIRDSGMARIWFFDDWADTRLFWKQFAAGALTTRLKQEAKDVSSKYIAPPYTTDFAILFLPFEGLYAEAVNRGMVEELQKRYKVNLAGPSTMAALLNSLQMGFRTLAIEKRSSEVWEILRSVRGEFEKFGAVLEASQRHLQQASGDLDQLIGVRTRQIQSRLKNVEKLEDGE